MKLNNFFLLIIKIKNIYEFNVLMLIYGCFPQKNQVTFIGIFYHAFTLPSRKPNTITSLNIGKAYYKTIAHYYC